MVNIRRDNYRYFEAEQWSVSTKLVSHVIAPCSTTRVIALLVTIWDAQSVHNQAPPHS